MPPRLDIVRRSLAGLLGLLLLHTASCGPARGPAQTAAGGPAQTQPGAPTQAQLPAKPRPPASPATEGAASLGGSASQPQRGTVELGIVRAAKGDNETPVNLAGPFVVPWQNAMTVADVLRNANKVTPSLGLQSRGEGEWFFVDSLANLANGDLTPTASQVSEIGSKEKGQAGYWTYRVNGAKGTASAGVSVLKPGDRVEWRFGPFDE